VGIPATGGLAVFFAGLGLLGGKTMFTHNQFGWMPVHPFPILMFVAALLARVPRPLLILTIALLAVTLVQPFWVTAFRGELLGSLHVVGGLAVFALAHAVARRSTALLRAQPVAV